MDRFPQAGRAGKGLSEDSLPKGEASSIKGSPGPSFQPRGLQNKERKGKPPHSDFCKAGLAMPKAGRDCGGRRWQARPPGPLLFPPESRQSTKPLRPHTGAGRKKGRCRGNAKPSRSSELPEGGFISAKNLRRRAEESRWSGGPRAGLAHSPQFPVKGAALGAEWSRQKGGSSLPSLQSSAASKEERERRNCHTLTAWRSGMALPSPGHGGSMAFWALGQR